MINNKENILKTEQAWNRLFIRLQKENLIPENGPKKTSYASLRWSVSAAAAVVFLILIGSYFFRNKPSEQNMLSLKNDSEITLVKTLEDGSIVYLAANSSIYYPKHFTKKQRNVTLKGEAFFNISSNRQRPFIIETEDAVVKVVGTAFSINKPFKLSVLHGLVKVTDKINGETVNVKAGETAGFHSDKLFLAKTTQTDSFEKFSSRIRFKDEKLGDIVRAINLNSTNCQLQVSPELKDRRLTVSFSNETSETMAQLISLALNIKCNREGDNIRLSQ